MFYTNNSFQNTEKLQIIITTNEFTGSGYTRFSLWLCSHFGFLPFKVSNPRFQINNHYTVPIFIHLQNRLMIKTYSKCITWYSSIFSPASSLGVYKILILAQLAWREENGSVKFHNENICLVDLLLFVAVTRPVTPLPNIHQTMLLLLSESLLNGHLWLR